MKILYLDIDGVINSRRTAEAFEGYPWNAKSLENFDKVAIALIQRLCEITDCKIVLSSSWRADPNWKDLAEQLDLPIIDRTPIKISSNRGEEVAMWLREHPEVTQYAIVDDTDEFLEEQRPFFVQTCPYNGLSYDNYMKLKDLLK